jgi:hypothetical protein
MAMQGRSADRTPVPRQNSTLRGALRISNMPDHNIASLAGSISRGWSFGEGQQAMAAQG